MYGELMIKVDKIVIVGGGSSGWMSAATMIKAFPDKEIVLIESPDYPTIGVGESTLGQITSWMNWLGIDDKDFMPKTDAVYKMSIKFNDFYKKDSGGFHYPFGTPMTEGTINGIKDWYVKKIKNPDLDVSDYAKTFYPALTLAEQNKISFNKSGKLGNFIFKRDVAYHFDATKFGLWLKNNYCIPRGVKLISETVTYINKCEDGIESLVLTNGEVVYSDLFIDCTGFKSMLLEGALEEPWDDFGHILPNNSAWACPIPYTDKEKEMEPFTNCTAISNGWAWNTPSWERIGTGYVFSDKYITKEKALEEFKEYLKSDKMRVYDPNRDVDSFTYRLINFKTGIHKRTFVNNVVAIGLSAGFIEPLESNGLLSVHEFLNKLVKILQRGTITEFDRDIYNSSVRVAYLGFLQFVSLHYALSNRDDTEYWRDISNKKFNEGMHELKPNVIDNYLTFADKYMSQNSYETTSGIHCIGVGLNYIPFTQADLDFFNHAKGLKYEELCNSTWRNWEVFKKAWQEEADNSPSMYQWLKENIYNK
jgi:tryptophan halogenase